MSSYPVCQKCLEEHPARIDLVTEKCFHRREHRREIHINVVWSNDARRLLPASERSSKAQRPAPFPIRPMPRNIKFTGLFVLCDGVRCRGRRCTFPHSREEQEAWNSERRGKRMPAPPSPSPSPSFIPSQAHSAEQGPNLVPTHPHQLHQDMATRPSQPTTVQRPAQSSKRSYSDVLKKHRCHPEPIHSQPPPPLNTSRQTVPGPPLPTPPSSAPPLQRQAPSSIPSTQPHHTVKTPVLSDDRLSDWPSWNHEGQLQPSGLGGTPLVRGHIGLPMAQPMPRMRFPAPLTPPHANPVSQGFQHTPANPSLSFMTPHNLTPSPRAASRMPPFPSQHMTTQPIVHSPVASVQPTGLEEAASRGPQVTSAGRSHYDNRQPSLTREGYKRRFHALLNIEEGEHERILREKCDGHFTLVLHQAGAKKPNWLKYDSNPTQKRFGYLEGLSNDQISYAAQASQGAVLSCNGQEFTVELVRENFQHIKQMLYIVVTSEHIPAMERCLPSAKSSCRQSVRAKFQLKFSYFRNLHRTLRMLPDSIVRCLLPSKNDFTPVSIRSIPPNLQTPLKLQKCSHDQKTALETIISCPSNGPPVLVSGSFGTGKTRLLATVAHYFFQERQPANQPVRVLVCAQQQVSADAFLEYFSLELMVQEKRHLYIIRLISEYGYRNTKLKRWYKSMQQFKRDCRGMHFNEVLIVTTCITAQFLAKEGIFQQGFFTHILLDEGAQMREPEAVASLCLAGPNTKIVIAGDQHQVGPVTLVLGEEVQRSDLKVSLLERLFHCYQNMGEAARNYCSTLTTNFRCHPAILELVGGLFYELPLRCGLRDFPTHPDAPYPLNFVCSSIDDSVHHIRSATNEAEARIVLQQVEKFVSNWPVDRWGSLDDVAVVSPHRSQTTLIGELLYGSETEFPRKLRNVRKLPTYIIQGHEFRAVFISTSEPTELDGSTCNPTKSICDRYVFNTTITRARSLVVAVGNPFLLLKIEKHMLKKYGEKGKCWSKFLKVCLEKGSLTIDPSVRASQQEKEQCLKKLRWITKADETPILQSRVSVKEPLQPSVGNHQMPSGPKLEPSPQVSARQSSNTEALHKCKLEKDYEIKEPLGKGGYGSVFHVRNNLDNLDYAVKVIRLPNSERGQKRVLREVQALAKLTHTAIVRYFTSWKETIPKDWKIHKIWSSLRSSDSVTPLADQSPYNHTMVEEDEAESSPSSDSPTTHDSSDSLVTFECQTTSLSKGATQQKSSQGAAISVPRRLDDPPTCLFIQTELCRKDTLKDWLSKQVHNRPQLSVQHYFGQILDAVGYIHDKGLIHRDLKPSNIFFSREGEDQLKVGDFGLVTGNIATDPQGLLNPGSGSGSKSFGGTFLYMSPEQVEGKKCDQKVDIFALGVILFELNCPFTTEMERAKVLMNLKDREFPPTFKTLFSSEAALIEKMLMVDPKHRPSVAAIRRSAESLKMASKESLVPLCL